MVRQSGTAVVRSQFRNHVLTMVSGTALAQFIPFAAAPMLSRLYLPAEFGITSAVVGMSAILAMLFTARYDLALVLAPTDGDALDLAAALLVLGLLLCAITLPLLSLFGEQLAQQLNLQDAGLWLYAIPVIALAMACGQIGGSLSNRHRDYRRLAYASALQQFISATTAVLIGWMGSLPTNGLLVGRLTALVAYAVCFLRPLREAIATKRFTAFWWAKVRNQCATYRQFAIFNLPYSLLGSFAREFVVIGLTVFGAAATAGYYALARTMLWAPVTFLSSALSQVFYREAVDRLGSREFAEMTSRILIGLAVVLSPIFAFVACWGPEIFAYAFGAKWRPAGEYAALLAVPSLLGVFTSWPERVFEIRFKQHWAFAIQIGFDSLSIGLVWFMLSSAWPASQTIAAFAVVQCLYHCTYLSAVSYLAGIRLASFLFLLGTVGSGFAIVGALHWATSGLDDQRVVRFFVEAIATALVAAAGLIILWWRAKARREPTAPRAVRTAVDS
jgi:O-antigen/teichoic acid export membrane protein